MGKVKTQFVCQECGFESAKWMGQCPGCQEWNSFVEEIKITGKKDTHSNRRVQHGGSSPLRLKEIQFESEVRMKTNIGELDRVLGGGIVSGSLVLIGGDPGIGKSTLLLQMCEHLGTEGTSILYITAEESIQQVKMRAERLGVSTEALLLLTETNIDKIQLIIQEMKPTVVVVDSIQTVYREEISSAPGSVSQVRESTGTLLRIAKDLNISIFIIGHVTKEGTIAGPRVLEHMVDTVLYFEGDRNISFKVLRAVKNRFGSTNEIGVFEMRESGLKEVKNPSKVLLAGRPTQVSGSVVTCSMEGTRPMLIEVQALVSPTSFGMPRRTATGTDYNRVVLLMAVLEKRLGMQLAGFDSYVNIAGGLKITEPALDLGIIAAIASSFKNRPTHPKTVVFGEVGLTGELRGVTMAEQRILEAAKMGFELCVVPHTNAKDLPPVNKMKICGVKSVQEALNFFI